MNSVRQASSRIGRENLRLMMFQKTAGIRSSDGVASMASPLRFQGLEESGIRSGDFETDA